MRSPSQIVYAACGSPPVDACVDHAPEPCWLCAGMSSHGQPAHRWTGSNFTDHDRVRCPESLHVCAACVYVCSWTDPPGRRPKRADAKRGTMFRMYSHLWEDGGHGMHGPGYTNCDKSEKPWIRAFIEHEHRSPWFAAIADGGKKHIIPFLRLNPPGRAGVVLFDDLLVKVPSDTSLIQDMIALLTAGPSKSEIAAGEYNPQNWRRCMEQIRAFESKHGPHRRGAWFALALWLSQRDETATAARVTAEKEAKKSAGRKSKGANQNARRGDRSRSKARVSCEPKPERAQALGSTARADEGGSANDRDGRGVGEPVRQRDAGPRGEQQRIPGFD